MKTLPGLLLSVGACCALVTAFAADEKGAGKLTAGRFVRKEVLQDAN